MRKVIISFAMALCLTSTFVLGASAHSISAPLPASHKVQPQASGGGCKDTNSSSGDISVNSCISLKGNYLESDAYVSFNPYFPRGYIEGCFVQILIISNHGQYPGAFAQYNCVIAASNKGINVHFGPISTDLWNFGDNAVTVVNVKMSYSSGAYSVVNNATSKTQYL